MSCCWGCTKRTADCHAHCKEYAKERAEREQINKIKRQMVEIESAYIYGVSRNHRKGNWYL